MAIEAIVEGNLLTAPVTKVVKVKDGQKPVVELRVMAASYRAEDDGNGGMQYVQDEKKTIPVQVSIWSERLGENAMKLLQTGARVRCTGSLYASPYLDSNGEAQCGLNLTAESVTLGLSRIESIAYREKAQTA